MVTYVFTPWREPGELLLVRRQFFPHQTTSRRHGWDEARTEAKDEDEDKHAAEVEQHRAVARVSMWMQRGSCPHLVESTALLTAAVLSDRQTTGCAKGAQPAAASSSSYAVRAAYAAAFSRFVTGLLDSHQDKQHKMSMYAVAKSVGLPATFVELRHQATHELLPSQTRLRVAAQKALGWIWDYYWRHLAEPAKGFTTAGDDDACHDVVRRYLDETDGDRRRAMLEHIKRCGETRVVSVLDSIADKTTDTKLLREVVVLTRLVLDQARPNETHVAQALADGPGKPDKDLEGIRAEITRVRQELRDMDDASLMNPRGQGQVETSGGPGPSWRMHENWVPKPIGMV